MKKGPHIYDNRQAAVEQAVMDGDGVGLSFEFEQGVPDEGVDEFYGPQCAVYVHTNDGTAVVIVTGFQEPEGAWVSIQAYNRATGEKLDDRVLRYSVNPINDPFAD